jgi:hypothetical protein
MKKSRFIKLVLITAALASCHKKQADWNKGVYMRSDTTAGYSHAHGVGGMGMWYYAFRPYGFYNNGYYTRYGYYSEAISEASNVGLSAGKSGIVRGGFGSMGEGGMAVSS